MKIKRYIPAILPLPKHAGSYPSMMPAKDGAYVLYSDLQRAVKNTQQACKRARNAFIDDWFRYEGTKKGRRLIVEAHDKAVSAGVARNS